MIIDAFTFFNEYDMLDFRLKMLWPVVDKFVIVEADHTFSGKPKPYNFEANKERYEWAKEKIIYHPVKIDISDIDLSSKPDKYDPFHPCWQVEYRQRDKIIEACQPFLDNDLLIIGDCDEIPSREVVNFRKNNNIHHPLTCQQHAFGFNLHNYCRVDWRGSVISTMGYAREKGAQNIRRMRERYSPFPYGGWHLTYFGGVAKIKEKIESFSHQEYNKPEFTNIHYLQNCVDKSLPLFGQKENNFRVEPDFFPQYFRENAKQEWWL